MRTLFTILLSLLFFTEASAQTILIQGPGASADHFQATLLQTENAKAITDYEGEMLNKTSTQEELLLEVSNLNDVSGFIARISAVPRQAWSQNSLNFINDYSTKALEAKTPSQLQKARCFFAGLLKEKMPACRLTKYSLLEIRSKFPAYQFLAVEGVLIDLKTQDHIELDSEFNYVFTLISNSMVTQSFQGPWEQLIAQNFPAPKGWIEGDCQGFSLANIENLQVRLQAQVSFPSCDKKAQQAAEFKPAPSWYESNKTWVFIAGALLLGGGAYYMKDKTLVIDRLF